nr:MAG TPA: Protein of unknown function (DUF551) [Caudoviricetes sp.]
MADRVNSLLVDLKRLKVETGSLACMGCGREHNCGVHGCAVLRETADVLQEYVDRCKRYADEIMALREKQQWISVTERLPAEGMRVLAASEGVFSGEAYLSCKGVWMRAYDVVWVPLVDMPVTHWMPLPYKPEVTCDG